MQVGIIGINSFSSSLSLREKVAKICRESFSKDCLKLNICHVFLSTCNRTEFYFSSPNLTETHGKILHLLRQHMRESFDQSLYSYFGRDCFLHLGRVISGMDSLIFGESDIQRQVKLAYELARTTGKLTPSLHYLFQKGLKIGKEMRTAVLPSNVCLPAVIYSLIECVHKFPQEKKILFIGNSAINRRIISYFYRKGCSHLFLCSRKKKEVFSSYVCIRDWSILENWSQYDAVISGTYHDNYILKRFSDACDVKRRQTAITLFDLGIPRNIDPGMLRYPFLYLYNIDDLSQLANQSKKISEKEIYLCETMIEKIVEKQMILFYQKQRARWRYNPSCEELAVLH